MYRQLHSIHVYTCMCERMHINVIMYMNIHVCLHVYIHMYVAVSYVYDGVTGTVTLQSP